MTSLDLSGLVDRIPRISDRTTWPAVRAGNRDMWLARNHDDMPIVLLPSGSGTGPIPTVELVHVRATFGLACELSIDGKTQRGVYSAIECRNAARPLQHYFLATCSAVLSLLPATPSPQDVGLAINQLVELFASIDEAPKKTVEGLWGELALIECSRDTAALVTAWHARPEERFDFASGRDRLEVKTTRSAVRRHHFALEQLLAESRDVLIVSIAVEPSGGGKSISDLVRSITQRAVDVPLQAKVFDTVARTLGRNWDVAASARFDLDLARKSIRFLNAADVPRVTTPLPPTISEVTFVADCGSIDGVDAATLGAHGGLWGSAALA